MLFKDRTAAGQLLAGQLTAYAHRPDVLVLALPRGGVPVAFEVGKALNAPLDVVLVSKLGVPGHKELAIGALASGGVRVINREVVRAHHLFEAAIHQVVVREQRELERWERLYRDDRPAPDLFGRTLILVDDGLATGATLRAAVIAIRQQEPTRIVVAVPISSPETCHEIEAEVDEFICAMTPRPFYSVNFWYENFSETTDEEVCDLLQRAANNHQPPATSGQRR
jgi:putative phosphoribosyl transferase